MVERQSTEIQYQYCNPVIMDARVLRNNDMGLNPSSFNKKLGVIVCADDFGASSQINEAIIRLLKDERISACSCLVTGKAWEQGSVLLKSFRGAADIGLHLIYDDMPYHEIVTWAYTKRLKKGPILKKFKSQLDRFWESMARPPDHIDGHKHIHQLPVFKSALMDLMDMVGAHKIYVRNAGMGLDDILRRKTSILKNMYISFPGGSLKKDLFKKEIPTNNDFLGIYDFNAPLAPAEVFEKFLRTVKRTNSIVMCHPSFGEELRYLESNEYRETLERYGLYLTRFTYGSIE